MLQSLDKVVGKVRHRQVLFQGRDDHLWVSSEVAFAVDKCGLQTLARAACTGQWHRRAVHRSGRYAPLHAGTFLLLQRHRGDDRYAADQMYRRR